MSIRIFPHSQEEFPSEDSLLTWLLTALRARGGEYLLRSANSVKDLPPGSLVLFRYGQKIVGEAIVSKGKEVFQPKIMDRTLAGQDVQYEAQVTFVPSSIRLYTPALPMKSLQKHVPKKNLTQYAGGYYELEWGVYANLLEELVTQSTFTS